jgi:hypothetical protein
MVVPENVVNTVFEWHISQAMPATGTWVAALDVVGNAPAASGIIFGW